VLGEEAPQVTAEDGCRAVELVDRIYRRIAGLNPVAVDIAKNGKL